MARINAADWSDTMRERERARATVLSSSSFCFFLSFCPEVQYLSFLSSPLRSKNLVCVCTAIPLHPLSLSLRDGKIQDNEVTDTSRLTRS